MAFFLALIYFILCVVNLIYNIFIERYANGFEAILVMGVTAIGLWLSWRVMSDSLGKKK
ncbi:MAG: hypothetical protein OXU23_19950 [Candidatus Poribacteria bacterium]|nr:hypothetical protein [Candidatus Poribacteria bacterium]